MIRKIYFFLGFFASNFYAYSQVGIGTDNPLSSLQVKESRFFDGENDNSKPDGIIIPKLTKAELASKGNSSYQSPIHEGVLVFVTDVSGGDSGPSVSQVTNIHNIGFYFLNSQNVWEPLTGLGVDGTDDAWVNNPSQSRIELGTTSYGENRLPGTEVVITDQGNFGINVLNPTKRLEINASNNSNLSDFIKIENLSYPPANTMTKTLQIDSEGFISKREDVNIEGKILRLPLGRQNNIINGSPRTLTIENDPLLSPNLTPNFINLIPGFEKNSNTEFTLPAGLYKYEVRLIGYFDLESHKNSVSLTSYVNEIKYSTHFYGSNTRIGYTVNKTNPNNITTTFNQNYTSFIKSDFIELSQPSRIKFEVINHGVNNFTVMNYVSIGEEYEPGKRPRSYRSVILFQRIK